MGLRVHVASGASPVALCRTQRVRCEQQPFRREGHRAEIEDDQNFGAGAFTGGPIVELKEGLSTQKCISVCAGEEEDDPAEGRGGN